MRSKLAVYDGIRPSGVGEIALETMTNKVTTKKKPKKERKQKKDGVELSFLT